jgi:TonB-dependent receptor
MHLTPSLLTAAARLALAFAFLSSAFAASVGTISGTASNAATGDLLQGVKVELIGTSLAVLTDATGHYEFPGVPAGDHELVATYVGLDLQRAAVSVAAGARVRREFNLTSNIYTMSEFKVTGEREGAALAITAQKNAESVKNVMAMDTFGTMSNQSASEMVIRLPGVAGNLSGSGAGLVDGFTVRGMGPGLNNVTIDGGLLTSQNAMNRSANINNITGGMFEEIELTKGQTPDKGVDSLGGTVNLKTRSPLRMREKRRVIYNTSVRYAPPFTEQIPLREQHRAHPLFSVTYQEVFSVFGGERNLGVAVSGFYSENVQGFFKTIRDFQSTAASPAYLWDYRTEDNYNNRMHASMNTKVHYRHSPQSLFTFTAILNDTRENRRIVNATRAYTNNSTGITGTAGVLPGFSDLITQVRASTASRLEIESTGQNYLNRLRALNFGGEHEFGPLKLDYVVRHNQTHLNSGSGKAGDLLMSIANVGWILDRTTSDIHPRFIQTEGPDFTKSENYRPGSNGLASRNYHQYQDVDEALANVRYDLPVSVPTALKAGVLWRGQTVAQDRERHRWSYIGAGPLAPDLTFTSYDTVKTGRRLPFWEAKQFLLGGVTPVNPMLWREDAYYFESQNYINRKSVTENVSAAYGMAQGRTGAQGLLAQTGYIAGVRVERTDTSSWGWVRARTASTSAQQLADPAGSARRDYANTRRELEGSYTKSFPSVHLTHDVTRNLKARVSWSTSFGRPGLSNLLPNETISEANRTLTVNNPALLPQSAKNWDATLDYYFEPVGYFSLGWFHKTITDYIASGVDVGPIPTGADNGYDGEYSGFTKLTSLNAGTAYVQGWEFSYQQQFTFLPGLLKGFGLSANYTILDTHGDFGGTDNLRSGEVAGFIPESGNASLFWRYRSFSLRGLYNYTSDYTSSYSRTNVALNLYRRARSVYNASLGYQVRPSLTLNLDIDNLTNEPQIFYRGYRHRIQSYVRNGITMNFGVSGRF